MEEARELSSGWSHRAAYAGCEWVAGGCVVYGPGREWRVAGVGDGSYTRGHGAGQPFVYVGWGRE